jgi:hypothetical protein
MSEPEERSVGRFHVDTLVAIFLLLFCGVFLAASFSIRETSYASLGAEVWPRVILVFLTLLSLGYLVQSLRHDRPEEAQAGPRGLKQWLVHHLNAFWCFLWFGLFLISLPYLGMLIGGMLFVFVTLTSLGRRDWHGVLVHAAIAVISVGAMWAMFTYGLKVFLPAGTIFSF